MQTKIRFYAFYGVPELKRRLVLLLLVLFLCQNSSGKNVDLLYIDSGCLFYSELPQWKPSEPANFCPVVYRFKLDNPKESEKRFLPVAMNPGADLGKKFLYRDFPLIWFISGAKPYTVFGKFDVVSVPPRLFLWMQGGCVSQLSSVESEADPGTFLDVPSFSEKIQVGGSVSTDLPRWKILPFTADMAKCVQWFFPYSLPPGVRAADYLEPTPKGARIREKVLREWASRDLSLEQTFWAVFSPSGAIARLPIPGRKGRASRPTDGWWPVTNPSAIRWMEIQYEFRENQFDTASLSQLYSEDFPWDGFSPIGGVQLAGHKVKTDKTETFWPQDADWLIWEKNTNGVTRLCQMKGGRWSPVREVPRAPQTIVVDNDTETVHLFYDFAIDRAEIDGSLRRLASFLKAPQPVP